MSATIALMTDFGLTDPFAGIMKGVILSINPSAQIVDISHGIQPGDIKAASFALSMTLPFFSEGTIFVCVVDPSVGTDRRAVAADIDGRIVVCPDNGILSWILRDRSLCKAVELKNEKRFLPEVNSTFHGRDVFAPVAAHLSLGVPLEEFGPPASELATFHIPETDTGDRSLQGEAVYIDKFGNLITNIGQEEFEAWRSKHPDAPVKVHIASAEILGISRSFGDVPIGHSSALFGSAGYLEIAVNGGNAAESLGMSVGSRVLLYQLQS